MKYKDYFDRKAARALARQVRAVHAAFDEAAFVRRATRGLGALEFSARVALFSAALRAELPEDLDAALGILERSLPAPLPDCEAVTDGWLQWPVGQFIADHGVEHFDASMSAMIELTQRFSSEFAVRPFVELRPEETLARLLELTSHESPHVRRWCSEGARPRLPWGKRLHALVQDPSPIWPVLEALKDDPELYVRRSVANNLNDIAKDHPEQVVQRCRRWWRGASPARKWVVQHGLRSLVKAGHPDALRLLGFEQEHAFEGELVLRPARPRIGESVELQLELRTSEPQEVDAVVDYRLEFARPGGRASSRVFKWTRIRLNASGELLLSKLHPLRDTSTRTLHPGVHRVLLQVNGKVLAEASFSLQAAKG